MSVTSRGAPLASAAILATLGLLAGPARAEAPFACAAPAECPSAAEVLVDVKQALGASTHGPVSTRVVVTRAVGRGTWSADIALTSRGETSTRHVEGDTCLGVADAVALIVAFATAAEPEPVAPPAPPPVAPNPAAEPRDRSGAGAGLGAAVAVGASFLYDSATLPAASFGGDVSLAFRLSRLRLEADGALLAPVRGTVADRPTEGADFLLVHAGLRASYDLAGGWFDFGPSAGAGVDWVSAKGFGSESPKDATATSADFTLGGRAGVKLSPHFALFLRADAVAPTARPAFVIDGTGTVYRSPWVAFRGAIGIEAFF